MIENLKDNYSRKINYLRISITDRCNLSCSYCSSTMQKLTHGEILSYEEILRIVRLGASIGISKVRITGGEPFLRKGLCTLLKNISDIDGICDIAITTNGVLLKQNINKIKESGIKRLNISLDTLKKEKFKIITGYDYYDQVWEGVKDAYNAGFYPIKLNVVALHGLNDDEILDFASLSLIYPFHIRFIEYMPIGKSQIAKKLFSHEIIDKIKILGNLIPIEKDYYDGPASRFKIEGAKGEIGIISPVSKPFCQNCNRLRITAAGMLRPCLLSDYQIDIKNHIRDGASDLELINIIKDTALNKQLKHNLSVDSLSKVNGQMSAIGG
ncbi:MAG: GTP 3',8-cyclase MoaA [Desulfobacterales bacterium]|nr:GTP 3',8-cyclase MoaA [Desulfobacterales bacterium]